MSTWTAMLDFFHFVAFTALVVFTVSGLGAMLELFLGGRCAFRGHDWTRYHDESVRTCARCEKEEFSD